MRLDWWLRKMGLSSSGDESQQTDLFPEVPSEPNGTPEETTDTKECNGVDDCAICTERVDRDDDTTYHEILSWVRGAKKDAATMREYTGRVAHGPCVSRLVAGIAPSQKSLEEVLDEAPTPSTEGDPDFLSESSDYHQGYADGIADVGITKGYETSGDYIRAYWKGCSQRIMDEISRGVQ